MSATGRGGSRDSHDYYPTPAKAVLQLLRAAPEINGGRWLEPGAGDGAIIRAVNSTRINTRWTAVELQRRFEPALRKLTPNVIIGDYRNERIQIGLCDVAIGNPPFKWAASFVHRSLRLSTQVVMLLRLNWLGSSSKRRWLFEYCGVPDLFVLAERPSFHPKGTVGKTGRNGGETDACDYAWMRWYADGSQKGTTKILWGER